MKQNVYTCEVCDREFIESSFSYINDPKHGTVCKMCDVDLRRNTANIFVRIFSILGRVSGVI